MTQNNLVYHDRSTGYPRLLWPIPQGLTPPKFEQDAVWRWSRQTIEVLSGGNDCSLYFYTKRVLDVVLAILKRDKMESLDRKIMGTAVTNLTRMDFPRTYGSLELDRLIMHPGGAFPLANVNMVVGAVTCAGKLSLILEYAEEAIDTKTVELIRDKAMEYLLSE